MSERLYYINNQWVTYEQAHCLGYSQLPQKLVKLYTQSNEEVYIKRDTGDLTYYDKSNLRWVTDFHDLGLYKYVSSLKCFRGETYSEYMGYSDHTDNNTIDYILYNESITDLQSLYEYKGITTYKCSNIISSEDNSPVVWYDSKTDKYFDDRDGIHKWVDTFSDVKVVLYDSSINKSYIVYENVDLDYFYISSSFINRDTFYTNDNYGIIRSYQCVFKDDLVYSAYYDSYSNEYCIPNITSTWVNREKLKSLGYEFIGGLDYHWLCTTSLNLPWKITTYYTVEFSSSNYPDLTITLPDSITVLSDSELVLPSISGIYKDQKSIRYRPLKWDIGEFNTSIIITNNTIAELILEPLIESPELALTGTLRVKTIEPSSEHEYIILSADGSMKSDVLHFTEKYFTKNVTEVFGDRLKIWDSPYDYTVVVPEFGKNSYNTTEQMLCGTIRMFGNYDNTYCCIFTDISTSMKKDTLVFTERYFEQDIIEVFGDRLKVDNS